jgi:hypothetical protein
MWAIQFTKIVFSLCVNGVYPTQYKAYQTLAVTSSFSTGSLT